MMDQNKIKMKTTFTTLLLLFTTILLSQNLHTIQTMQKATSLDQVKSVSDQIINSSSDKYTFYKIADSSLQNDVYKVVLYTLTSDTDNDPTKLSEVEKTTLIKVKWLQYNNDFTFKEIYAPEQMIKPFWNSTFVADNTNYRVNKDLQYKLVKNEKTYSIERWY